MIAEGQYARRKRRPKKTLFLKLFEFLSEYLYCALRIQRMLQI